MGQHYIYNYEVLARSEGSGNFIKDLQHMFRRYEGYQSGSQVSTQSSAELTSTGKLVDELCQPSASSTSKVGSFFSVFLKLLNNLNFSAV